MTVRLFRRRMSTIPLLKSSAPTCISRADKGSSCYKVFRRSRVIEMACGWFLHYIRISCFMFGMLIILNSLNVLYFT